MSKSLNKFLKLIEKHKHSSDFNAINLKKSKIALTADVLALIKQYHLIQKGNFVYFKGGD
jgi:hypothetical protein